MNAGRCHRRGLGFLWLSRFGECRLDRITSRKAEFLMSAPRTAGASLGGNAMQESRCAPAIAVPPVRILAPQQLQLELRIAAVVWFEAEACLFLKKELPNGIYSDGNLLLR